MPTIATEKAQPQQVQTLVLPKNFEISPEMQSAINAVSKGKKGYFAPDGVHLVPTGVSAYVIAIDEALK